MQVSTPVLSAILQRFTGAQSNAAVPAPIAAAGRPTPSDIADSPNTCVAPASDSGGSFFFKAVFKAFARLTQSDSEGGDVQVMAKQKVQIELESRDNGDVSLQVDIQTKIKVKGLSGEEATKVVGDLMEAMKTFTASLFSALQNLFAPHPAPVAGPPAPGTPTTTTTPTAPATPAIPTSPPAPAPTPATQTDAALPAASDTPATPAPSTEPAPPATAAVPSQPAPPSIGSMFSHLRLQATYATTEFRIKLLIDEVVRFERKDATQPASRRESIATMKADYDKVAGALHHDSSVRGAVPSLVDFLHAMRESESSQSTVMSYSMRSSAQFFSAQA